MRFEELNLSTPLLEAVAQLDFTEMTEIQEKAIPSLFLPLFCHKCTGRP